MEIEKQEKYRGALIEKYEQRAWECLALYNYYGRHYATIEENCKKIDGMIEEAETQIKTLESGEGSQETYEKIKSLKEEIKKMEKQIESVGVFGKTFFEKATTYQEEGGRILEQIDDFKAFKLKTPEQIAADKEPKVAEKPDEENTNA